MIRVLALMCRCSACLVCAALVSCGGGSGGGSPTDPATPAESTYSVTVTVFYDENANGQLDAAEGARVPGVEVVIGAGEGTSGQGTGQAVVSGIRAGNHTITVRTESLPFFYQAGAGPAITVPGTSTARYPLTLPIGDNNRNFYMGFGDSITAGDGSSDGEGYRPGLQSRLGRHFARAEVRLRGREADTSSESAEVIRRDLRDYKPAYTLVLLGTNDWHRCQSIAPADCFTIGALRSILQEVKAWDSLPVLGTVPPVNPALAPAGRNDWIEELNVHIGALAREQGALLADVNAAFKAQGSLPPLFDDDVHPSDAGYDVLAQAWFEAISNARSVSAAGGWREFGVSLGR